MLYELLNVAEFLKLLWLTYSRNLLNIQNVTY